MLPTVDHFIDFLIKYEALRFGQFTLKSGRISPYFFNLGAFQTGAALQQLGQFYATALQQSGLDYDMLFGPAYKGIPLVSATGIALADQFQRDVPYCFNRKEKKDHGDGGELVGAPLQGRVIMLDDVITAGTTVRETVQRFAEYPNAKLAGIVIAFDRQERGSGEQSATQEAVSQFNVPVQSIVNLQDVLRYLHKQADLKQWINPIERYRQDYAAA